MVRNASALLLIPVLARAAEPGPEEAAFRKRAAERYLAFAEATRERLLVPASCPFSPAAIVLAVGSDPAQLASFVRARIAYEPYAGVVRGAEGTLAAQAGGDWDRAVLLQALLAEAGYLSRLRVVRRTEAEAAAVVDDFLRRPAAIASWYAGVNGAIEIGDPAPILQEFGVEPENRRFHASAEVMRVRRILDECLDAAAVELPHLSTALGATKVGQPLDSWRARLLAGAAERVEVEVEGPGVLAIAPDAAPIAGGAATLDAPPGDRIAKLSIRLAFTPVTDGKPAEPVVLLDRELPLGSLFRKPIRLEIVPSDEAAAAKPAATWTDADWFRFVSGFQYFQAVLRAGDEWEASKVFDLGGNVHGVSADGRMEGASKIAGTLGRGLDLGGLGDEGEPEKAAKPGSRLEALTLTIALSLPGEEPQIQERLIHGAERPDATPVFTADLLATPGPVCAHATVWLTLDAVTRNAPLRTRMVLSRDPRRFEDTDDAVRFPTMLHDWQALRLMLVQRAMAADRRLTFLPGPTVVMRTTTLAADRSRKAVLARGSMDVALDRSLLVPRAAEGAEAAAAANTSLGLAATVLESAILRSIDPAQGARGAFSAFEEARANGAKASSTPSSPPAIVGWSLARNEKGRALVFPGGERSTVWWSLDARTGQAIGRGDGGEGQSAMEYLQITKKNIENLKCMVNMSNQVLGGKKDMEITESFITCMTGTDNRWNGHGVPGAVEGYLDASGVPQQKFAKIGMGPIADALGGAVDLYDLMNRKDPVLFKGR